MANPRKGDLPKLVTRLGILRTVEEKLFSRIIGSSSPSSQYHPARASEVSMPSGSMWKSLLKLVSGHHRNGSVSSSEEQSEDLLIRQSLAECRADIEALWKDKEVRERLKQTGVSLKEQPGL